ncbi:MAG: hypothetical protein AAF950_13360 [Pseudomonadota bacterium]
MKAVLSFFVAVVVGIAVKVGTGPLGGTADAAEVEAALLGKRVFITLRDEFPSEYSSIVGDLVRVVNRSPNGKAADDAAFKLTEKIRRGQTRYAKTTPSKELRAVFRGQLKILEVLKARHGIEACSEFAVLGGASPSLLDWDVDDLIDRAGADNFSALAAGRDRPAEYGDVTLQDIDRLESVMLSRGVSHTAYQALINGFEDGDYRACDATIGFMRALKGLDMATANRIMSATFVGLMAA